jgi:RNA polymerase sigma-70 factor (ECF subfamily)
MELTNASDHPFDQPRADTTDELVTLFSSEVWRFSVSQISHRDDAEDVVMETFAAAFRDFPKVLGAENQLHWLLAVARRKAADHYRKQYRRSEQPISDSGAGTGDLPSSDQLVTRQALAALSADQREALILKYVNGLSTDEVGEVMRRSGAATNSLLQRARESLRLALNPNPIQTQTENQTGEDR